MPIGSQHPRSRRTLARAAVLTAVSLAFTNCLPFQNRGSRSSLTERERVVHLLSRTTYGVRAVDVEQALQMGRKEWLERQLHPEAIPDLSLDARIAARSAAGAEAATGSSGLVMPPVIRSEPAPGQMLNAVGPEVAALRELAQAMEAARQQLEVAQEQLVAAQRLMTDAQARASERDLTAARRALEEAHGRYQLAQQHVATAQRNFDAVSQRMNTLNNQFAPMPNAAQRLMQVRTPLLGAAQSINLLVGTKLERAVHSERQLEEVMTDFWFNHFNVYFNKGQVRLTVGDYEQNAIRKHVFGRFQDLLVATAQHPAMLVYLDNSLSTAPPPQPPPGSPARPARPQRGGLNENYARELMELHTLGVDGGYTQQDVIDVARAFTGWGVANRPAATTGTAPATAPRSNVVFEFRANQHDNGDKVVLGRTVTGGRGVEEGMEILQMLARHPATAHHIATKLVRHFVADDPPAELVEQVARVFLETDGDLREVTRALFLSSEFYRPEHYRAKVKRPFEYIASTLRVTGAEFGNNAPWAVTQLRAFRHLPYSEAAPTGYATTAEDWVSAGAMLARMNFGLDLAADRLQGVTLGARSSTGQLTSSALPLGAAFDVSPAEAGPTWHTELETAVRALLDRINVGADTGELATLITEDLLRSASGTAGGADAPPPSPDGTARTGTPSTTNRRPAGVLVRRATTRTLTPAMRALGLALGSPEFQRY